MISANIWCGTNSDQIAALFYSFLCGQGNVSIMATQKFPWHLKISVSAAPRRIKTVWNLLNLKSFTLTLIKVSSSAFIYPVFVTRFLSRLLFYSSGVRGTHKGLRTWRVRAGKSLFCFCHHRFVTFPFFLFSVFLRTSSFICQHAPSRQKLYHGTCYKCSHTCLCVRIGYHRAVYSASSHVGLWPLPSLKRNHLYSGGKSLSQDPTVPQNLKMLKTVQRSQLFFQLFLPSRSVSAIGKRLQLKPRVEGPSQLSHVCKFPHLGWLWFWEWKKTII